MSVLSPDQGYPEYHCPFHPWYSQSEPGIHGSIIVALRCLICDFTFQGTNFHNGIRITGHPNQEHFAIAGELTSEFICPNSQVFEPVYGHCGAMLVLDIEPPLYPIS